MRPRQTGADRLEPPSGGRSRHCEPGSHPTATSSCAQLLPAAAVRAVGSAGLRSLQRAGWTAAGTDPVVAPPLLPIKAVRMRDAFGDAGLPKNPRRPGLQRTRILSRARPTSWRRFSGRWGSAIPLKIPRVVYPADLVPRQPGNFVHKDYGAVQDMFTCWVPLGDVPRALGGLAVRPGSHHSASVRPRPLDRLERGLADHGFCGRRCPCFSLHDDPCRVAQSRGTSAVLR